LYDYSLPGSIINYPRNNDSYSNNFNPNLQGSSGSKNI
jgi:hypothetical protein